MYERLWDQVRDAEAGRTHYPTPADCPHKPGTPEFREWQGALIVFQTSYANPNLQAEMQRVGALRKAMNERYGPTPEQRRVAALVAEVEDARRPEPVGGIATSLPASAGYEPARLIVSQQMYNALMARFSAAAIKASGLFQQVTVNLTSGYWTFHDPKPPRRKDPKGRPLPPAKRCYHGNQAGRCRACSTGRRQ